MTVEGSKGVAKVVDSCHQPRRKGRESGCISDALYLTFYPLFLPHSASLLFPTPSYIPLITGNGEYKIIQGEDHIKKLGH